MHNVMKDISFVTYKTILLQLIQGITKTIHFFSKTLKIKSTIDR